MTRRTRYFDREYRLEQSLSYQIPVDPLNGFSSTRAVAQGPEPTNKLLSFRTFELEVKTLPTRKRKFKHAQNLRVRNPQKGVLEQHRNGSGRI